MVSLYSPITGPALAAEANTLGTNNHQTQANASGSQTRTQAIATTYTEILRQQRRINTTVPSRRTQASASAHSSQARTQAIAAAYAEILHQHNTMGTIELPRRQPQANADANGNTLIDSNPIVTD